MASVFEPTTTSVDAFTGSQRNVQNLMADVLSDFLGTGRTGMLRRDAMREGLSGESTDTQGIEDYMVNLFDTRNKPQIDAGFSAHSGLMSSRRGTQMAQSFGDTMAEVGKFKTGLMESARQRQMQYALGPLSIASQFSTTTTRDTIGAPPLFGDILKAGGTIAGAILGAG